METIERLLDRRKTHPETTSAPPLSCGAPYTLRSRFMPRTILHTDYLALHCFADLSLPPCILTCGWRSRWSCRIFHPVRCSIQYKKKLWIPSVDLHVSQIPAKGSNKKQPQSCSGLRVLKVRPPAQIGNETSMAAPILKPNINLSC